MIVIILTMSTRTDKQWCQLAVIGATYGEVDRDDDRSQFEEALDRDLSIV